MNENHDILKSLIEKHEPKKAPEGLTKNVMGMIKSGVSLEEEQSPLIQPKHLIAAAVIFFGLLVSTFVFDISFFTPEAFSSIAGATQLSEIFGYYQQVAQNFENLIGGLLSNNIMIISVLTLGFLVGLDKLLRKKTGHASMIML